MASESITYDFLSRGADRLASDFRKTGDNATIAARGARLCADALEKQRRAAQVSSGATIALAKADDILKEAEHALAEGALEAEFALKKQGNAAKEAGRESAAAAGGIGLLAGSGGLQGGGLAALVAAGAALSPVLVTVGAGVAGLGAAAADIVGPILKAGDATKQARDELAKLDPAQRAAYDSLGTLKTQFHDFSASLEPQVLGLFSGGLRIASGLMGDLQPVAKATGDALGGLLGAIDAEFRSRTWQDFFGFMAKEAGPDVKLITGALIPLLDLLPRLLTDLQPIAEQFLKSAGGALKLADNLLILNDRIRGFAQHADHSSGLLGRFAQAAKDAIGQILPGVPAAQKLGEQLGKLGDNSGQAAGHTDKLGESFRGTWPKAQTYAQWVQQAADATKNLMDNQQAAVDKQLAYGDSLITASNDAQALKDKLKASSGQIGLQTQAQRDSFSAANTYIGDLSRQAAAAVSSGHGTDAAITAIKNGLPALDTAKTKNKQYWQEVQTLVNWLKELEKQKFINTAIHVTGSGKWSVAGTTVTPGVAHGPQNIGAAPGGFAFGGLITRGRPGVDDQLILAQRGEVVVPTAMVQAGAVDHLRGRLPGFAAGGVTGTYGPGPVSGLPPWIAGRLDDTDRAISQNTAQAALNAMRAAQAAAKAAQAALAPAGTAGGGVQRWRPTVLTALGMAGASPTLADAVLYQMQTESGGNPYAVNKSDINWQLGHPSVGLMQVIAGTYAAYGSGRMGYPPPVAYGVSEQPLANTYAAIRYAQANYGPGLRNAYGGIGTGRGYAAGGVVGGHGSKAAVPKLMFPAWLNKARAAQAAEAHEYTGLMAAFYTSLVRAPAGSWLRTHAFAVRERLYALAGRQNAEQAAWQDLLRHTSGSAGNLDTMSRRIDTLASRARAESGAIQPALLGHVPGGHPLHVKALTASLAAIVGLTSRHPYNPPWAPSGLGPARTVTPGVLTFDRGGLLPPGLSLAWNGGSRPETVTPAGGGDVHIHLHNTGVIGSQQELDAWLTSSVNRLQRTGYLPAGR